MVNSSGLATACFLVRKEIDLRIIEFSWPKTLQIPVFDFEVSISLRGNKYTGRGTDLVESQALDSAIGEAFERSLYLHQERRLFKSFAVHINIHNAHCVAVNELIERDSFFSHFLSSTPFEAKVVLDGDIPYLAEAIFRMCREAQISIECRRMAAPTPYYAVIMIARGANCAQKKFGVRVGLGCSSVSQAKATEKAAMELLRMISDVIIGGDFSTISADSLHRLSNPGPNDHIQWALHTDSAEVLSPCLDEALSSSMSRKLDLSLINTKALSKPDFWPSIIPLVPVGANHPDAIPTFFGSSKQGLQHLKRLSEFSGRQIEEKDLPTLPHPLG